MKFFDWQIFNISGEPSRPWISNPARANGSEESPVPMPRSSRRSPERTVLYRVFAHHFGRFLAEYERRFEREFGFFRPVVKEVVGKYLDCGNPRFGFALIRPSSPPVAEDGRARKAHPDSEAS